MRFKSQVLALALAAAAAGTHAENITQQIVLMPAAGQPGTFSGGWGATHLLAGSFTDTFTFTPSVQGFVSASLVSIGFSPSSNINLMSVSLNGMPFTLSAQGNFETAVFGPTLINAPLVMTIVGTAAPGFAAGTAIAASYAATLNVSAVPEPGTAMTLLAGLMAVGFLAGRRKAG